jgi:copper transport protein
MWSSRDRGATGAAAAIAVAVLVLVGAGILPRTAPAAGSVPGTAPLPSPARTTGATVADLVVTVSAAPNRPGPNEFTVQVASSRRPPPAPVDGVQLDVGAGRQPLEPAGAGVYTGTGQLPSAGTIRLTVQVHRAGRRLTVPLGWSVGPAAPPATGPPAGPPADPVGLGSTLRLLLAPLLGALALGLRRLLQARSRRGSAAAEPVELRGEPA